MKLSTAAYQTLVHSDFSLDGIQPDISVTPKPEDIIAYRDTVYQYVLHALILGSDP